MHRAIRCAITLWLLLACALSGFAANSLGGLACFDSLKIIFDKMKIPDMIQALRMEEEENDRAALMYQRQGLTIIYLTPYGDRLMGIQTDSPVMVTDDGIKVGDPRSLVISKRGQPEETITMTPGRTMYWYWSQGIHFCINDRTNRIVDIFIFPPIEPEASVERMALPASAVGVEHQYRVVGQAAHVVGRISSRTPDTLHGMRIGLTLRDRDGKPVDVIFADIGTLLPNANMPFKVSVPPRSEWVSYYLDVQAYDTPGPEASREGEQVRSKWRSLHRSMIRLGQMGLSRE